MGGNQAKRQEQPSTSHEPQLAAQSARERRRRAMIPRQVDETLVQETVKPGLLRDNRRRPRPRKVVQMATASSSDSEGSEPKPGLHEPPADTKRRVTKQTSKASIRNKYLAARSYHSMGTPKQSVVTLNNETSSHYVPRCSLTNFWDDILTRVSVDNLEHASMTPETKVIHAERRNAEHHRCTVVGPAWSSARGPDQRDRTLGLTADQRKDVAEIFRKLRKMPLDVLLYDTLIAEVPQHLQKFKKGRNSEAVCQWHCTELIKTHQHITSGSFIPGYVNRHRLVEIASRHTNIDLNIDELRKMDMILLMVIQRNLGSELDTKKRESLAAYLDSVSRRLCALSDVLSGKELGCYRPVETSIQEGDSGSMDRSSSSASTSRRNTIPIRHESSGQDSYGEFDEQSSPYLSSRTGSVNGFPDYMYEQHKRRIKEERWRRRLGPLAILCGLSSRRHS